MINSNESFGCSHKKRVREISSKMLIHSPRCGVNMQYDFCTSDGGLRPQLQKFFGENTTLQARETSLPRGERERVDGLQIPYSAFRARQSIHAALVVVVAAAARVQSALISYFASRALLAASSKSHQVLSRISSPGG